MIYREHVQACSRGGTYKYFLPRDRVEVVWERLQTTYGPRRTNDAMKTMEIESERFIFRATFLANPVTVIRKRLCTDADVIAMHATIGFVDA